MPNRSRVESDVPARCDGDVRRPRAGPPSRLPWVLVERGRVAGLQRHSGRVVAVADLHRPVVDDLLHPLGPQIGRHPGDVARVGLLDGQLPDRPPLRVIRVQQLGPGDALEHEGELPGQVVRVLHAGVAAEAAVGRHRVGGVPGQEDPPLAVALGAVGDGTPGRDVLDGHRDLRDADGGAQQLERTRLVDGLRDVGPRRRGVGGDDLRPRRVADQVDDEKASVPRPVQAEEAAQHWVGDVVDALVAPRQQRAEVDVGAEVDGDAVGQQPVAAHGDAELVTGGTAIAVSGDDILCAHRQLGVLLEVQERGGDAVGVLHERAALSPVAQLRAQLPGALAEDRLQRVLVDEHPDRGAELLHPGVQVGEVAGDLAAGERLDVVDPAVGEVLLL